MQNRMSVSDRLEPLIPQVSASSGEAKDHPSVCLSPLSLSSPVIKKKAIQIPSFDDRGATYEKCGTKQPATDSSRSFVPISSSISASVKTSGQPSWSKSYQYSQRNCAERASTLPRTKPKTYSSPTLSAKPSISIFPAPKPNSSPTLRPKPRDSFHLSASQLSDPYPLPPKPRVSPILTVPTPRLSPSPTSLCHGKNLDGQGAKQPSPVAKERRARSIAISNTKYESEHSFSNEAKHDILDQEALLDFTYPELRRAYSISSTEFRHHTRPYADSQRPAATSLNSCLLGLSKTGTIAKDKPKPPPRNVDISAIPKPRSNIKQQQGTTGTQTSLAESEAIKSANVVQRESQYRNYTQTASVASNHPSYEQMHSERRAASMIPKMSYSTAVSPNVEGRRRRFDLSSETRVGSAFANLRRNQKEDTTRAITGNSSKLSQQTGASQMIKSPQKDRFWSKAQSQTTQMDVQSRVSQSDCVLKDYSCQSGDIDQEIEEPQCAHRLNRLKTCLVAPQTQEASHPASLERTISQTGTALQHQLDRKQSPGRNENHKEANLSDTGLNQTDILSAPDCHWAPTKLLEYPSEKCGVSWSVALCPLNTNSFGTSSKGVFDLPSQPQHRVYQRPEETTAASLPAKQLNYSQAERAFIMEEPEDPYYVTMYYPGSVYVGEYRVIQTTWETLTEHSGLIPQSIDDRNSFISYFDLFFVFFFNLFWKRVQ
ncbi:serine/arginine repetitive matrix protein 2-like [Thunnus thynnus]|uniref:serine/arginine repetitive matrix protein 2-like n=1 Tax=Thunnus thynnus TaxID=8237 RepID=UPI0035289722